MSKRHGASQTSQTGSFGIFHVTKLLLRKKTLKPVRNLRDNTISSELRYRCHHEVRWNRTVMNNRWDSRISESQSRSEYQLSSGTFIIIVGKVQEKHMAKTAYL
nr:hypothetical protein CFP56_71951 [Quercus suber]